MRLIENWRKAHKLWSVRLIALQATLLSTWVALPSDMREMLPYANTIAAAVAVATLVARLIQQDWDGNA